MEPHFPTQEEVDLICARARRLRAEATRRAVGRAWAMLRRSVTRKETARAPRHA